MKLFYLIVIPIVVLVVAQLIVNRLSGGGDEDGGSPTVYPSRPGGWAPTGGFSPGRVSTMTTNN